MDTTGLYVRTKKSKTHSIEHMGHGSDDVDATYTTWLFAGDNHRMVTSWNDSSYSYFHEFTDYDNCIQFNYSALYKESYLYYKPTETKASEGSLANTPFFNSESKTAHNSHEMVDLLLNRPKKTNHHGEYRFGFDRAREYIDNNVAN